MGQKINPIGLRLGINRTWDSRWFAEKGEYAKLMHEDVAIRAALMKQLKQAAVSKIVIERPHRKCRVTIHSGRPGVVIGKKGADIEKLRKLVGTMTKADVTINIVEVRKPEIDATLVAESIAQQLERRVAFRRAMKRAVQSAMRLGAEGIRINCAGRLGGAEIARTEWYREGRVPLHTLRADVDYGTATAFTTYGTCGIKVWVFKGEILEHDPMAQDKKAQEEGGRSGGRRERDGDDARHATQVAQCRREEGLRAGLGRQALGRLRREEPRARSRWAQQRAQRQGAPPRHRRQGETRSRTLASVEGLASTRAAAPRRNAASARFGSGMCLS